MYMTSHMGKAFYFLGLTGSGMAAIARVLLRLGYQVSGWDDNPDPDILLLLQQEGAEYKHWSTVGHLDCVVYSTAIAKDHPAMLWATSKLLPLYHRSDVLSWLSNNIPTIAICGCHGKTTTSSMIHHAFKKMKIPHVVILGGMLSGQIGGHVDDNPQWLIIEACESDKTFLKYQAKYVVLTNISKDHLEYYQNNLSNLIDAFALWMNRIQAKVILPHEDKHLDQLTHLLSVEYDTVGFSSLNYALEYRLKGINSIFKITAKNNSAEFMLAAPGEFNVHNAAMVIALLDKMKINIWKNVDVFEDYKRVARRFEHKTITNNGQTIEWISDYGHHPDAILFMIKTLREIWPNLPLRMVFEPHRYTRTASLFDEFVEVLREVDELLVMPIYAASETGIRGVSSALLVEAINLASHRYVSYMDLEKYISSWADYSGIVLFQGAGNIHKYALQWLENHSEN